ncbi:MAG: serine/threonine protein kinase, partial [Planctomycetia bacterium]
MLLEGRFEIQQKLSENADFQIFRALDKNTGSLVAIKSLRPRFVVMNQMDERFAQEFMLLCKLQHPNIVRAVHLGVTEDNTPYFAMEYVAGSSLKQVSQRIGPMSPSQAYLYLAQVASALDCIHHHGIVHRDVNPEHIFVQQGQGGREVVKLLDFGFAKILDYDDEEGVVMTRGGLRVGRADYMSPEQARGQDLTTLSDVYALGVMGYLLLTGRNPFEAKNNLMVVMAHMRQPPPPFTTANPR